MKKMLKSMASKIFLDANVLLDLLLRRSGFSAAKDIFQYAISGYVQLYTSPAVIHITSYYIRKHYSVRETKQLFTRMLLHVEVIDCDHQVALTAINSSIDDIEDALQYYTALKHKLNYFISTDKKLKKQAIPQLPIYAAAEILTKLT
jgi:predicted nucleic acid-binding protein